MDFMLSMSFCNIYLTFSLPYVIELVWMSADWHAWSPFYAIFTLVSES